MLVSKEYQDISTEDHLTIPELLLEKLIDHKAFQGRATMTALEKRIQNMPRYTCAISQGMDRYHFVLTYVDSSNRIKFKNLRIYYHNNGWGYKNGFAKIFADVDSLISYCLNCIPVQIKYLWR